MTKKELEKFYDEKWENHIKETSQISLLQIEVADKKFAEKLKKEIKIEKKLNKVINEQKESGNNKIVMVPVKGFPEVGKSLKEIIKEMKEKWKNSIIGPFQIHPGVVTLFFIKSFDIAQKKAFTDEMISQMKKLHTGHSQLNL